MGASVNTEEVPVYDLMIPYRRLPVGDLLSKLSRCSILINRIPSDFCTHLAQRVPVLNILFL